MSSPKAHFIALPVGQGDAFYLHTPHGSMLVDGGKSRRGFPDLFRTHTRSDSIDIVVVTHNDSDHTNGIIGFLESGLKCEEIWLPAQWARVLEYASRPWDEVVSLIDEAVEIITGEKKYDIEEFPLLEAHADRLRAMVRERDKFSPMDLDQSGWPKNITNRLEKMDDAESEGWDALAKYLTRTPFFP